MSEEIANRLQLILNKLERVEGKLEEVVTPVVKFETVVHKVQSKAVTRLEDKTDKLEKAAAEMDKGLEFINAEVEELKEEDQKHLGEIKALNDKILYQEVGIQEARDNEKDTREIVHEFLEKGLGIQDARRIEFQRIHPIGRKRDRQVRPIIARILRYGEREMVYEEGGGIEGGSEREGIGRPSERNPQGKAITAMAEAERSKATREAGSF